MSKLEEAIGDLKYHIGEDPYFNGTYKPVTDFEKYGYNHCKAIETVLEELNNSIPKQYIQEKIEKLKKQYEYYEKRWESAGRDKKHPFYKYLIRIEAEIDILEELLEGK